MKHCIHLPLDIAAKMNQSAPQVPAPFRDIGPLPGQRPVPQFTDRHAHAGPPGHGDPRRPVRSLLRRGCRLWRPFALLDAHGLFAHSLFLHRISFRQPECRGHAPLGPHRRHGLGRRGVAFHLSRRADRLPDRTPLQPHDPAPGRRVRPAQFGRVGHHAVGRAGKTTGLVFPEQMANGAGKGRQQGDAARALRGRRRGRA